VRLAEGGATPHEIMSITGHLSLDEVERYTRAANTKRLANSGIWKRSNDELLGVPLAAVVGPFFEKGIVFQCLKSRVALPRGLEHLFSP
jgi:integrase/recombinase XerD